MMISFSCDRFVKNLLKLMLAGGCAMYVYMFGWCKGYTFRRDEEAAKSESSETGTEEPDEHENK